MCNVNFRHLKLSVPFILIGISFVIAFNIFLKRLNIDDRRQTAQFGMHEADIGVLQELSGNDLPTMLAILKDQVGISTVIVPESTIGSYERLSKVTVLSGHQIINTIRVGQLYRTVLSELRRQTTIVPNATYVVVDEIKVYKRVISYLKLFLPKASVIEHKGRIIQVNLPVEKVMRLPLGFSDQLLKTYMSFGLNIIPEFKSYATPSTLKVDATFSELADIDQVHSIMFSNDYNFGDSDFIDHLLLNIQRADYKLIFPEFLSKDFLQPKQFHALAAQLSSEVVVSHGLTDSDVTGSFDYLFNRYMRALKERAPHLLVLAPVNRSNASNLYDKNILYMRKVIETYQRYGGEAVDYFPVLSSIKYSFAEKALMGIGIFSAIFLVILKVHRLTGVRQTGAVIAGLCVIYAAVMGAPRLTVPMLGLIAVIIGPTLGMIYFYPSESKISGMGRRLKVLHLTKYISSAVGVCLVSAVYCVALYSDPVYLQNIIPFKGVKLGLLMPVILVGLYFYCGDRRANSIFYVLRRVFRFPLTLATFFVLLMAAVVILMYIFRSGNYLQLLEFEANIRVILEKIFVIRPRFKEFLIGYPALIFGFWFADRKLKDMVWFLNALGVIALASVINSFCHFHTPVLVSLYRSFFGLFLGVLFSIVVYNAFSLGHRLVKSLSFISDQ